MSTSFLGIVKLMVGDIRVSVEFMGPFEFDFGTAGMEITLRAPATIATLLDALAEGWPGGRELRRSLGDATSARRRYCLVSVDYVAVAPEAVLDAPLRDGARVCFAMPMVGG